MGFDFDCSERGADMDFDFSMKAEQNRGIDSLLKSRTFRYCAQSKITADTKAEYSRLLKLMHNAKQLPHEYATERNLSKKAYNKLRYAFKHRIIEVLRDAKKSGDEEKMKAANKTAKASIKELNKSYEPRKDATKERQMRASGRVSKRTSIRKLPQNWREQVQAQLQNSKYRDAALILHLSGCRPGELVKGVEVRIKQDGSAEMYIKGCKQNDRIQSGQTLRRITYAADTPHAAMLKEVGQGEIKIQSAQAFQKRYKDAAVRALGKPGKRVTPYSARHQFSADMKKNGYSKIEVAAAMGHQSTRSQGQYGMGNQSKGGGGKMQVAASQKIRDPDRTPMQSQQQSMGPVMRPR
jgi:integrase